MRRILKGSKVLFINFLVLIVFILIIEIALHLLNVRPLSYFLPTASNLALIETKSEVVTPLHFFIPDSLGLQKIDLSKYNPKFENHNNWSKELYYYIKDAQLNEDGFRGNSFKNIPANKTKVMFIGDSYVFGYEAVPITNSFVDLIQENDSNLYCLNMGVGSTDLCGYNAIAQYYVPKIKPNIVVLCIYINDFIYYNKKQIPFQVNDYFLCYEGVLSKENNNYSQDSVKIFNTANDAFKDTKNNILIINTLKNNRLKCFLSEHSRIYTLLNSNTFMKNAYNSNFTLKYKKNYSAKYVNEIIQVCKKNNALPLIVLIPDLYNEKDVTDIDFFKENLQVNFNLYYPKGLNNSHYNGIHMHFNNKGYEYYANFVSSILDTIIIDNAERKR